MLADYDASIHRAETRKREETPMPFYEKGNVRIHYEDAGSRVPLLVIPGGGLNSTIAGLKTHPFNPFDEFAKAGLIAAGTVARPYIGQRRRQDGDCMVDARIHSKRRHLIQETCR